MSPLVDLLAGRTVSSGSGISKVSGVAKASISKVAGVAAASISKVAGVAS